jgi:hypothetical protein
LSDSAPLSISLDQQQLWFHAHSAHRKGNVFLFSSAPFDSADQQQQLFQLFGIAFVFSTDGQQILLCSVAIFSTYLRFIDAHFSSAEQYLFTSEGSCFAIDDDRPRPGAVQLHGPVPLQGKQQRLGHCYKVLLCLLD